MGAQPGGEDHALPRRAADRALQGLGGAVRPGRPERAPAPRLDIARGRRGQPGRRLRDQHHALDGLDGPDGPDHDAAREVSRMFVLASSRGPWRGRRESRYGMNTLAYTG